MLELGLLALKKWWPQIVAVLAVIAVVGAVLWWDHGRIEAAREEGRAEVQAEFDAYRTKQQQMVTALALMWAEAIQKVEVRYVQAETKRAGVFSWFKRRAEAHRPATDAVVVRVPSGAIRLLHDAHAAANDPRSAASDQDAAAPVPDPAGDAAPAQDTRLTDWIIFGLDAAEAYADARQKWAACVEFVDAVRGSTIAAQNSLSPQTEEPK